MTGAPLLTLLVLCPVAGLLAILLLPGANKTAIRQAIESLFGVKVTGVWTSQQRGKPRRVGQSIGLRPRWKKAIVKLRAGDTIEIFEG